jgi:hypothetical protein
VSHFGTAGSQELAGAIQFLCRRAPKGLNRRSSLLDVALLLCDLKAQFALLHWSSQSLLFSFFSYDSQMEKDETCKDTDDTDDTDDDDDDILLQHSMLCVTCFILYFIDNHIHDSAQH